jgi:hypothetical protein
METKISISLDNQSWLQSCAKNLNTTPEIFLNTLLTLIKLENGHANGNIKDWLERGKKIESACYGTLSNLQKTRSILEEVTKAAELYLNQAAQTQKTND